MMNDPHDQDHELDKRLAGMGKKMNVLRSDINSTLNAFRVDMEKARTDAERRDKETARRETINTRWIMASILAAAGLIVIILGFMLRLSVAS